VVNRTTGESVASPVYLWRLDAPENENWGRGDQLQATVQVPVEGATIRDLPAGRYRARCAAEAEVGGDPPSFRVQGSWTEVVLELAVPRTYPAYVRLFDELGVELELAELRTDSTISETKDVEHPGWLDRREPKPEGVYEVLELVVWEGDLLCDYDGGLPWSWSEVHAGPLGFQVGWIGQDTRAFRTRHRFRLRGKGGSEVKIEFDGALGGPPQLLGVSVDRRSVEDHLFLPDGSPAAGVLADRLEISSAARSPDGDAGGGTSEGWWLEVPIRVQLTGHDEYEDLDFSFRLADGALEDRFLVPRR